MARNKRREERKRDLVDLLVVDGPDTTTQLALSLGMQRGSSGYVKRLLDELQSDGWVTHEMVEILPHLPHAYMWYPTRYAIDHDYRLPPVAGEYDNGDLPF